MTSLQRLVHVAMCRPCSGGMECRKAIMCTTVIHRPGHQVPAHNMSTHGTVSTDDHQRAGRASTRKWHSSSLASSGVSWRSRHNPQPVPSWEILERLDIAEGGYSGVRGDPSLQASPVGTGSISSRSFTTSTGKQGTDNAVNQPQLRPDESTTCRPSRVTTTTSGKDAGTNTSATTGTDSTVTHTSTSTGTSSNIEFKLPNPELRWEYLINPDNEETIQKNINDRKGIGDIQKVKKLWNSLTYPEEIEVEEHHEDLTKIKRLLIKEAMELPNMTHPDVSIGDESQNRLVETVGTKPVFTFQPKGVVQLGESLGMLRTENLGHTSGPKTYYLVGGLAQLEQALIRFTVDTLEKHGFMLVSVPDLIHPDIVERCGFKTTGDRTQVYKLDPRGHGQMALAGTGEMPIAGMFLGRTLDPNELPVKVMTVSRCYRAETSDIEEERGIYRVHQFTKVECFGVTSQEMGTESEEMVNELLAIQRALFTELGLHFRILDMASQELGAPAYRKYDMETWMPAKQFWGEISSTSNCIDYQSRRLSIKYSIRDTATHVHTVNGTACAIPRMIMAILENNQLEDGRVEIPPVLHPYMDGTTVLEKPKHPFTAKWIKLTKLYKSRSKSS